MVLAIKYIKANQEEVVHKGVTFHVNFKGLDVQEVAVNLLNITNAKVQFDHYGIVDVSTFNKGSDIIISVSTIHQEATLNLLKQAVADASHIQEVDTFTLLDFAVFDVAGALEEEGLIEELQDVMIKL